MYLTFWLKYLWQDDGLKKPNKKTNKKKTKQTKNY